MADATLALTHYCPWDANEPGAAEERAICGAAMADAGRHSLTPTCPACAAHLAAEDHYADALDALVEATPLPLDAEEAADLRAEQPLSPLGADLFTLGVTLNRVYAQSLVKGRRR